MNVSFIKLDVNIMNDTKIKLVRKMPDGDSVLALWIGLLCLGMKSGRPGIVEIGDGIPFTPEALSIELDIPVNTVKLGIEAFVKFRMIEIWDSGETYIMNFEKHQELGRIEVAKAKSRESTRRHREKAKLLSCDNHVTVTGGSRDTTDKDIDKDTDKEEENTPQPPAGDNPNKPASPKKPACPYTDIVALWNEMMPELPQIVKLGEPLKKKIRARWNEDKEYQALGFWRWFFGEKIRTSDFLMGRTKEPFRASLDWVCKPSNWGKIYNGNYENTNPPHSPPSRNGGNGPLFDTFVNDACDELEESYGATRGDSGNQSRT